MVAILRLLAVFVANLFKSRRLLEAEILLLVDTENNRVGGRINVETDHIGGFCGWRLSGTPR